MFVACQSQLEIRESLSVIYNGDWSRIEHMK